MGISEHYEKIAINVNQIFQADENSKSLLLADLKSLLLVFSACDVSFEDIEQVLNGVPDLNLGIGDVFVELLKTKLDKKEYLDSIEPLSELRLKLFDICEEVFIGSIENLIMYSRHYREKIESIYPDIKNSKIQCRNQTAVVNLFDEIAKEEMGLIYNEDSFSKCPEFLNFLSQNKLNNLPGRFAFNVFSLKEKSVQDEILSSPVAEMTGHDYERYIASLIAKAVPHANVEVTKGSGDQGADILVTVNAVKIAIQTKKYSGSVGNDAVQQVYAAKGHYDASVAMVITNSTFTQHAETLAEKLGVLLIVEENVVRIFSEAFN